jgi:hypothetical protein
MTCATAILAIVQKVPIFGMFQEDPPFEAENEIVVSFENVDHTKAMYFCVAGFFQDHQIDDIFPTVQGVALAEAIVNDCKMGVEKCDPVAIEIIILTLN